MDQKRFLSPRGVNKELGFPLNRLRSLIVTGQCPGFYSGNRFMIDVPAFQRMLDTAAQEQRRF